MSGFKKGGVDLDSIFAARVGAAGANSNFKNVTVDLAQRYEQRGGTTAAAATGFRVSSTDISDRYKAGGVTTVSLTNQNLVGPSIAPVQATSGYRLGSTGDVSENRNASYLDIGDWVSPKSAAPGTYECRVTVTSGTLSTGTAGSWLALTSNREWTVFRNTSGSKACTFTVEIRQGVTTLASCTVTITASVF